MTTSENKWKMNQSTKINQIGCDTIVNSPSIGLNWKPPIYFADMNIQFQNPPTNYLNVEEFEFY